MSPEPYTVGAVMVVVILTVILYDIYLVQDGKTGNTYSEVLRKWFKQWAWLYYLVAFVLGVLMAHWGIK